MKRRILITLALVIVLLLAGWALVHAASSGPNLPTAAADQHNGDGWTNPTNVELDDGSPAAGNVSSAGVTSTGDLYTSGYGFSIPAGSTINGITATVKIRAQGSGLNGQNEMTIKLLKAGTPTGTNKSTGAAISTATTTMSYGGAADLWGNTLGPSDVNATNFGLDINYAEGGPAGSNVYVDATTLTVTYTPAGASSPHVQVSVTNGAVVLTKGAIVIP